MKPIAITMGDPAGIGPELCLRAVRDHAVLEACRPVICGDVALLERVASVTGLAPPPAASVIECGGIDLSAVRPGEVQAAGGQAAFNCIRAAVERALAGEVAAVVTAPINKEALRAAGVPYPGHTEMLAALTGSPRVCMMLASDDLVVSMVTTHIGLAEVSERLTAARIRDVIELTAAAMTRIHNRPARIGVCGFNPHAGEHGLFGNREEERSIEPAIAEARATGLEVEGPIPPDTAFVPHRRRHLDAVVCMYHDQGHIPFKMLAFETGVNITLGLPIVRVSVDHGTAFDIAWQAKANPASLIQAVQWAVRLCSG